MVREGLAPGVEHGGDAELGPEVLRVASEGLQGFGGCVEEQTVE